MQYSTVQYRRRVNSADIGPVSGKVLYTQPALNRAVDDLPDNEQEQHKTPAGHSLSSLIRANSSSMNSQIPAKKPRGQMSDMDMDMNVADETL